MNRNCLDIGTIQSYLDCELDHDEALSVSSHIADCDSCAMKLAQAEEESAFVFSALDREFDTLVPTQRLWNNINTSIDLEKRNASLWTKCRAFLATALMNPSFAAAAAVIIVIGAAVVIWNDQAPEIATTFEVPLPAASATTTTVKPELIKNTGEAVADQIQMETSPELASGRPSKHRVAIRAVAVRRSNEYSERAESYLPGEENYLVTIASLSSIVEKQKDGLLRPSERVSFERDLAVVNQAIERMKAEVARNPRNEAAKKILYASYQNKIDLLNSISQREELMASLN